VAQHRFAAQVTDPNTRCKESLRGQRSITMTGTTAEGAIQPFTGIVQAVEQCLQNRALVYRQRDAH
jgi:hypothetical protein